MHMEYFLYVGCRVFEKLFVVDGNDGAGKIDPFMGI